MVEGMTLRWLTSAFASVAAHCARDCSVDALVPRWLLVNASKVTTEAHETRLLRLNMTDKVIRVAHRGNRSHETEQAI